MSRALLLLPAIDLRGGKCVRLERGDPSREKQYDDDPSRALARSSPPVARALHVVDLDGAFGSGENHAALHAICTAVDVPVQTGGGVRTVADAQERLAAGAASVVLGTVLIEEPATARAIVDAFGSRIIAGIDARGDRVATRGWQNDAGVSRDDLVRTVAAWGIGRIVFTEIARDGMARATMSPRSRTSPRSLRSALPRAAVPRRWMTSPRCATGRRRTSMRRSSVARFTKGTLDLTNPLSVFS